MNEKLRLLIIFLVVISNFNVKAVLAQTRPFIQTSDHFGNTFGKGSLEPNTYIARNIFFENLPPLGPGPLAKALFSNDFEWASSGYYDGLNRVGSWNQYEDLRWRQTTRAPYFENKVPGENKIIPASAVLGAATAFGLVTLLPLAVPKYKPLMYCNSNLNQLPIRINNENVYICNERDFEIVCSDNFKNQMSYQCINKKVSCNLKYNEIQGNIYCRNNTLFSKRNLFCPKTINIGGRMDTMTVLECAEGNVPDYWSSFIPTTTPKSSSTTTTTTKKPLSLGAKIHVFLLELMGKFDVEEEETTQQIPTYQGFRWYPEPLTISPETEYRHNQHLIEAAKKQFITSTPIISTTRKASYQWMRIVTYPNNITRYEPLPKQMVEIAENGPKSEISSDWIKVLISD